MGLFPGLPPIPKVAILETLEGERGLRLRTREPKGVRRQSTHVYMHCIAKTLLTELHLAILLLLLYSCVKLYS